MALQDDVEEVSVAGDVAEGRVERVAAAAIETTSVAEGKVANRLLNGYGGESSLTSSCSYYMKRRSHTWRILRNAFA